MTLEDLLKVKRLERPSAEFWVQFERELRAKQLAAIVDRRPWWAGLSRAFAIVTRQHVPIGAMAVLALTFVSLRQFEMPSTRSVAVARMNRPSVETVAPVHPAAPLALPLEAEDTDVAMAEDTSQPVAVVATSHVAPAPVAAAQTQGAMAAVSHSAAIATRSDDEFFSPSAHLLASNLAAVRAANPDLAHRFLGGNQDFAANATSANRVMDPMARLNPVSDERRSRLLAPALPAVANTISAAMTERTGSHLSEDRLYDSVSRYGVDGHSISIKF